MDDRMIDIIVKATVLCREWNAGPGHEAAGTPDWCDWMGLMDELVDDLNGTLSLEKEPVYYPDSQTRLSRRGDCARNPLILGRHKQVTNQEVTRHYQGVASKSSKKAGERSAGESAR